MEPMDRLSLSAKGSNGVAVEMQPLLITASTTS